MVVAASLLVVGILVVVACVQHARSQGMRSPGLAALRPKRLLRRRPRPLLQPPADDLPPAGLKPLIPSPRVIAHECERGLRELTLFLAAQTGE